MIKKLTNQIKQLEKEFDKIPVLRKEQLDKLAQMIKSEIETNDTCALNFICTHNSRRSQLAEVWTLMACKYYGIDNIEAYSGGTEATAFNIRMVRALTRFGLDLEITEISENPVYHIEAFTPKQFFSKKYDHTYNPQSGYTAIMVCDHADANCPIVSGATNRFSLQYKDPKAFDESPEEENAYDDKVIEIGREILYLAKALKQH